MHAVRSTTRQPKIKPTPTTPAVGPAVVETSLARRLRTVRAAAGYCEGRRQAEFARLLGIKPSSLHALESGATKRLGKSIEGYLSIGANPDFILYGTGEPMMRHSHRSRILLSFLTQLTQEQIDAIECIVGDMVRLNETLGLDGHAALNDVDPVTRPRRARARGGKKPSTP